MIDMFEKIDGDRIKSLGYVGRLTESMPTGNQLKALIDGAGIVAEQVERMFL
jgi:hypothetical protein